MKPILLSLLIVPVFNQAIAQSVPSYVPTTGLYGWWSFDGDAKDGSGNGAHGTVNGAVLTDDRYGTTASAYFFNGTTDFIITSSTGLTDVTQISVSAWIKMTGDAGGNAHDSYFEFGVYPKQSFSCGYNYSAKVPGQWSSGSLATSCKSIDLTNTWHHLVVIDDNLKRYVYIDGVKTDTFNFSSVNTYKSSDQIIFGGEPSDNQYFTGSIDEIGLWNRPLTATEVWSLYTATTSINENSLKNAVSVSPNPTINNVQISVPEKLTGEKYSLSNILGQEVMSGVLAGTTTSLSLDMLSRGIYVLQVGSFKKQAIKIIKE